MIRTPQQYLFTYDAQASKYLSRTQRYIDGIQEGKYLQNGGVLSLLFDYCESAIVLGITGEEKPNNVLDKIIVSV